MYKIITIFVYRNAFRLCSSFCSLIKK